LSPVRTRRSCSRRRWPPTVWKTGSPFHDTHRAGRTHTIEVPVTTLDTWWSAANRIPVDAVKIDTEGAELWVLRGAEELIRACRPSIIFELHPRNLRVYPHTAADVLHFFENRGYTVTALDGVRVTQHTLDRQLESCNDYAATCEPR
jgi:hypothetical protein